MLKMKFSHKIEIPCYLTKRERERHTERERERQRERRERQREEQKHNPISKIFLKLLKSFH